MRPGGVVQKCANLIRSCHFLIARAAIDRVSDHFDVGFDGMVRRGKRVRCPVSLSGSPCLSLPGLKPGGDLFRRGSSEKWLGE